MVPVRVRMPTASPTVLLLSTSDTDLITARASGANYRWANPVAAGRRRPGRRCSTVCDVVVVRILGGYRAWQDGIDAVVRQRVCRPSSSAVSSHPTPT